MANIAVIGAGHGGLAAAARLKVKDHQVTVFEMSDSAVTPSAPLTLPAAYRDFFLKTGSALEKQLELVEIPSAIQLHLKNDQTLSIPGSGLGRTLAEIEKSLGTVAAQQWRDYSQKLSELWITARADLVESQMSKSLRGTVGWKNYWRFRNYQSFIRQHLTFPELVDLTTAYRNLCAVDSSSTVGLLAINSYIQQIFGVYEPEGGSSQLTNALVQRCAQLGVEFKYNMIVSPVAEENELIGIETEGGNLQSVDFVVVNDLTRHTPLIKWHSTLSYETNIERLFVINEHSWLGLGPAHAVLGGQIVAGLIGSATI